MYRFCSVPDIIKTVPFLVGFAFLPCTVFAQIFEDFENNSKGSYASSTIQLNSGEWLLDDALIGSSDNDRFNGTQSARIRDGHIEMLFDLTDGASSVQFYGANSGFSGDTGGRIQLFYSTDQGSTWIESGNEIELTEESVLERYSVEVNVTEQVRFKLKKTAGNRINIDDFRVEPYVELSEDPVLKVTFNGDNIAQGDTIAFIPSQINSDSEIELRLSNIGEPDLTVNEMSTSQPGLFSVNDDLPITLSPREFKDITISFNSEKHGTFYETLEFETNNPERPVFALHVEAFAVDEGIVIPINKTKEIPFGTRVKIGGRVTVANEFAGPAFLQDHTAAIAVFYSPLHTTVKRGDSLVVQGPLTEFNPIDGTPGTFLRQIAPVRGDSDISFDNIGPGEEFVPDRITLEQMNSGVFESRLISVENTVFLDEGVFQGNQNLEIRNNSGTGIVRIDNSASDIIGASIPRDPIVITGVVDRFNGVSQLKPRDANDLNIEPVEFEGEDIPRDSTFDVVTWNIEWFGSESRGPLVNRQFLNVKTVVETINADLYAFQEISNRALFAQLIDELEDYRGFVSFYPQSQQTAYLFKTSVIDSLDSGQLRSGQNSRDWASGRFPLFFTFDATVNNKRERITSYNIHAKALSDRDSYLRRRNAANSLKFYLDEFEAENNSIVLGDFNDQFNASIYNMESSPYKEFDEDSRYFVVTKELEDRGFASYLAGQFRSFLDHIVITNRLIDDHINGSQRVENPNYIDSFVTTTSDHAPVWTRFILTGSDLPDDREEVIDIENFVVGDNFPNPFHSVTTIPFSNNESGRITVTIYDIIGRHVKTLTDGEYFETGVHEIDFEGSAISSGMYLYRVVHENGEVQTKKMILMK